ncbi:MAG: preprotein translocase subunit SecE [Thermomicrobiales bacterium]
MAAQRRSATKQRRRGSAAETPGTDVSASVAADAAAPVAEAKKPSAPSPKASAAKQTASAQTNQVSKFRTTWENLRKAFQNTVSEIRKVTWPDAETTRNLTALVIAMSTALGLLLGGIDYLLLKIFAIF